MKYPVFALFGIALAGSGCFNPHLKNGGFACSGSQDGQCPTGFFCVNGLCVDNPNAVNNPGVGGNGGATADLSQASAEDMSRMPPSKTDLARPLVVDMANPVVADMTRPPPPDMTQVNACAHDKCVTGGPLKATCDPCVAKVCSHDSVCCKSGTVGWDTICLDDIIQYCSASQQCP